MSSKDKVNLFALHSTAKVNSYIEIYNPDAKSQSHS